MATTTKSNAKTAAPAAAERERPIPESMLPSEAGVQAVDLLIARMANALLQAVDEIDDMDHPIERAIGSTALLDTLTNVINEVKEVRRAAVKDAYEMGRSEPGGGWYGYSALGNQIGLSPSRVRQILYDISISPDGKPEIRDDEVESIREVANARRDAIRMIKAGAAQDDIVTKTGLTAAEIVRIAKTIKAR